MYLQGAHVYVYDFMLLKVKGFLLVEPTWWFTGDTSF